MANDIYILHNFRPDFDCGSFSGTLPPISPMLKAHTFAKPIDPIDAVAVNIPVVHSALGGPTSASILSSILASVDGKSLWESMQSLKPSLSAGGKGRTYTRVIRTLKEMHKLENSFPVYNTLMETCNASMR